MNDAVIQATDLSKTFSGDVMAVSGFDLVVPRGTVYGLIGRNGAGKTTAIRMLMGLLRANHGRAELLGQSMWTAPLEHRERITYVSQDQQVHAWMTLRELCHYVSHFYTAWDQTYADRLAERFDLARDRMVGLMSGGQRRKVAILLALAARPEVLIMDEPAAGLDPIARRELVDELVDALAEGEDRTVLFSTHILADLERVADHVGIMDRGRIVTSSAIEDLQTSTKRVQIIFEDQEVPPGFKIPGAVHTDVSGPVVTAIVRMQSETQLDEIKHRYDVRINIYPLGLEEIFIELVGPNADQP